MLTDEEFMAEFEASMREEDRRKRRDRFAIAAMTGVIAARMREDGQHPLSPTFAVNVAANCYRIADAMLAERTK